MAAFARYIQETQTGLQPVEVRRREGGVWSASMLQGPAEFGPDVESTHVMAAVGLDHGEAHRELSAQVVSMGLPALIAPLHRKAALADAAPDAQLLETLLDDCGAVNAYLVWHDGQGRARARTFGIDIVGGEDPATGSAAGALGAYLARAGRGERVEITQGVEMGRPSRLLAEVEGERVRVGGDVVMVIEGTVSL